MEALKQLRYFREQSKKDKRIRPNHISLYMAFYWYYYQSNFQSPFTIYRKGLMELAAISSIATYHKCLKELVNYGYIHYEPSYDSHKGSQVQFRPNDKISNNS
jgi:hypothetical protein